MTIDDVERLIKKLRSWRDVREFFNRIKSKWQNAFRYPILMYLADQKEMVTSAVEIELIEDLAMDIEVYTESSETKEKKKKALILPTSNINPSQEVFIPSSFVTIDYIAEAKGIVLREVEKEAIRVALQRHKGKRDDTAYELGISVRTLGKKIQQYRKAGVIRLLQ